MKALIRVALVLLLPVATNGALGAAAEASPPFAMRGWQLHEYSMPRLEEAVRRAPGYGVNFLIFSHELFRSVEGFLASDDDLDPVNPPVRIKELKTGSHFELHPGWQHDIRRLGDLAAAKHLSYYLWIHEFDDVPRRFLIQNRVNLDDPGLLQYLDQRYERLLAAVPGCAGFVLTFHESDRKLFRDTEVSSAVGVPERMVRVTKVIHDVLARHGRQLILRNFFYEPEEMRSFKEALAQLPDDIIVMSKDTTHEFHPFYPWDPMHGQTGKKRQIIETDLGVEKAWSEHGAYAQTDYIRRVVQRARDKNLAGLVGRCRLFWAEPFSDSHEVNLYSFSRFLREPDAAVETVLLDWARQRFPDAAAPYVAAAFRRTEFIHHHGRWHLENWFTKSIGDQWGNYPYYFGHLLQRSRFKWTSDPSDQALEASLCHPDRPTFDRIVAEKDEVLAQVNLAQADLEKAFAYLTAEQRAPLEEDFRFLVDAARLQREWVRAYFAQRMFMGEPRPEYRMMAEDAMRRLEQYEATPGFTYGIDQATKRRYKIDQFVLEMRWRLANRRRALAEDQSILERVKKAGAAEEN